MRKRPPTPVERIRKWVGANVPTASLGAVVVLQLPFTVMYFAAKPAQPAVPARPKVAAASTNTIASKPAEPTRQDPFAPLPGLDSPPASVTQGASADSPKILSTFRGESGLPPALMAIERSAQGKGSVGSVTVPQIPAAPSSGVSAPASPAASVREERPIVLVGVAKFRGKSVAVFQLYDKSTVYSGEGERVSGTEYYVQTILPTKVCVKRQDKNRDGGAWLFVGEESRA